MTPDAILRKSELPKFINKVSANCRLIGCPEFLRLWSPRPALALDAMRVSTCSRSEASKLTRTTVAYKFLIFLFRLPGLSTVRYKILAIFTKLTKQKCCKACPTLREVLPAIHTPTISKTHTTTYQCTWVRALAARSTVSLCATNKQPTRPT